MANVGHAIISMTYMMMPREATTEGFDSTAILCCLAGKHG